MTTTPTSGAADLPSTAYAALPTSSHAGRVYEEGFLIGTCPLYTADKMRAFADATHALRASHGQASSQAGEYPALVCDYCGALTPDPWHSSGMLHGKMSKHIHSCDACAARGQAPALTNLNCKSEQKRLATLWGFVPAQAASVQEDAARLDFIQECGATVEILPGRLGWTFRVGGLHGGVHGSVRAAIDAERQAFRVHGRPELHAAHTLRAPHG